MMLRRTSLQEDPLQKAVAKRCVQESSTAKAGLFNLSFPAFQRNTRFVFHATNVWTTLNALSLGLSLASVTRGGATALAAVPVPTQPSIVSIIPGDRRLYVQDRRSDGTLSDPYAFVGHGMNWSPTSVGTDPVANPNIFHQEFLNWYLTDLSQMAQKNVNMVRTYHDFGTGADAALILDEMYRQGMKTVITVDSPSYGVIADTNNIVQVVNAYKNHPAVLMWAVGNEWDLPDSQGKFYFGTFPSLQASAQFVEQSALLIKSLDGNHPVSTFCADIHIPGIHPLSASQFPFMLGRPYMNDIVNSVVTHVDVWASNVYRGFSFGDLFNMWRSISDKPFIVGEFGADAGDHRLIPTAENQTMQGSFDGTLWDEIEYELSAEWINGAALGGFKFEWQDELYKNGTPAFQNFSTEFNPGQPDQVNDEEYFGANRIDRTARADADILSNKFLKGQSAVILNSQPTLSASSSGFAYGTAQFGIDNKTVYYRTGGAGGGRGVNVGVLDANTGIRMQDVHNFDTWISALNFDALISYLQGLPNGAIITLALGDEGGFIDPNTQTAYPYPEVEAGYRAIEALGSTSIRQVGFRGAWAMITKKGQSGAFAEGFNNVVPPNGTSSFVSVQATVSVALSPLFGHQPNPQTIESPNPENGWQLIVKDYPGNGVYDIQTSNDMNVWVTVKTDIPVNASGITTWTDDGTDTGTPPSVVQSRFYRAVRR